jgi:prevent-host-death family protein
MIGNGGETLVERIMPKVISATEASNNFGNLVDEAAQGKSYFVITRMGKAKAVVLGVEQYREMLEELEIVEEQANPEVQEMLKEALEDVELGRTMSLEELDRELGFTDDELNA